MMTQESFASNREKAETLVDWFKKTPNPSFVSFRKHFNGSADVVDYYSMKDLHHKNKLDVDAAVQVL